MVNNETVDKVLLGKASEDEAKSVATWFEHPQGSLELVERIDHDLQKEWNKQYIHSASVSSVRHWIYRVACALLIVVGTLAGGYSAYRLYIQPSPVAEQVAYAGRGERTQVVLQDGTRIFLNSESQIAFPSRFTLKERRIRLSGEAYFEVSKNPHRPFVVEMDQASVKVLGTHFNARSYADEPIKVMLEEGSVQFSAPQVEQIQLQPGEMVDYDTKTAMAHVLKVPAQSASAWRKHRLDVNNMPLDELIKMMERNYDVTFAVMNKSCYNHSFTLSMDDRDLNEVLKRMDRMSPITFRYNKTDRRVVVY